METYVINSSCIAMTDNALSFNVVVKDDGDNLLAEGNVLINSMYRTNCSITYHTSDSIVDLNDEIAEHCMKRAYTVFQVNAKQKKGQKEEQET